MAAYTEEQLAAINAQGRTIVSASAGSGKTTVMIKKIIDLIEGGCEVSQVLAVTFTKKAASQMKEKLCKALIGAINAPDCSESKRKRLKRQLSEVPSADISTIHSFCSKLIRSHFYAAGVDNTFRVIGGDDAEGTALKNEALNILLDEGYESKDEQFLHLLSVYWRKKSDDSLRKIFLDTYEKLRCRADYKEYLSASGNYDESTFDSICEDLLAKLKEKCAYYLNYIEDEIYFFENEGATAPLALSKELAAWLQAFLSAPDYFFAVSLEKPKLTTARKSQKDSAEKRMHMERLAFYKDKIVEIYKDLSETASREEELKRFLTSAKTAAALSKYLLLFDKEYDGLKRERGVLDYNDLEHIAYRLLSDAEVANEVRKQYRFVFVDEYQDVNPVQEAIVSKVGGENLFLVGDVKQSIYGFRGSRSRFFVEKQKQFETEGLNLKMTRNFRSSDAVLDAVNGQFVLAMTPMTSAVDYARDSYMERGGRYALNDGRVQLHILPEPEKKAEGPRAVYSVRENAKKREAVEDERATLIRHIIEKELSSQWYDADSGEYKRVRYSDIAILSRKKQGRIAKTVAALSASGIPVTAAAAVNICDYAEIKTLIDILSLLDNAEQDIPLCSALLSTMGNLTADELSNIRLAYPEERFFRRACKKYAAEKTDDTAMRLNAFYAYFEEKRRLARVLEVGELLTEIITETRMEASLLSRNDGDACLKRIHRFIEESTQGDRRSVHAFLDRLRDLNYKIERSENGGEDSVKVITMHSSKGLEYPVVIIDDLDAPFRGVDKDAAMVEEKYGLAPKAFDETSMLKSDTLLRTLHEIKESESSVADELNLYYVALTRAKYALHIICKKTSVASDVRYAKSFADFTDFSAWHKYLSNDNFFDIPKQERQPLAFTPDEGLAREIMQAFSMQYAFLGYENLPVKSSATALIGDEVYDEETLEYGDTSIEQGLAYHAFLERFDFSLLHSDLDLQEAISQTLAQMPKEEQALLSVEQLVKILSNPVFSSLTDVRLYKERQFLVSLPVKDTYAKKTGVDLPENCEGEMLFQGAIDLLAVGENEARVIDYKYSAHGANALAEKYRPQLDLYRRATAKILDIPLESVRCTIVNIYRGFEVEL